ncbi:MAG: glycosyltransferase family 2 protein [Rhodobacteraceae bacterium]|nr:glycosyltransferase family 2 protein [Paracoccaceae bacterium]MCP5342280.1 glycosyltransferase family 2 protein [Paracoccaceae bacterium]
MADQTTEVTILMALFDGERHLRAQLDSYASQTHPAWALMVGDDGSSDAGAAIIRQFADAHRNREIRLIQGPGRGFARNFLGLLQAAGPSVPLVALSDQDDIWLPEKLARGVKALAAVENGIPALYCARTHIVAPDLTPITLSRYWARRFSFANALVQNVAAGNTIMLNRAALNIAQAVDPGDIAAHDWWLYQIISGAGGRIIWDDEPVLLYRQHPGNEMGRNDTPRAWVARLRQILSGGFRDWNERNIRALRAAESMLTPANRALLERFAAMRSAGLSGRLAGLFGTGIYRQTTPATVALWLAALFNRL